MFSGIGGLLRNARYGFPEQSEVTMEEPPSAEPEKVYDWSHLPFKEDVDETARGTAVLDFMLECFGLTDWGKNESIPNDVIPFNDFCSEGDKKRAVLGFIAKYPDLFDEEFILSFSTKQPHDH